AEVQRVLQLYRDRYQWLTVRHFYQLARRQHGVRFCYAFVKKALPVYRRWYSWSRGRAVCSNTLTIPQERADRAVLHALERDVRVRPRFGSRWTSWRVPSRRAERIVRHSGPSWHGLTRNWVDTARRSHASGRSMQFLGPFAPARSVAKRFASSSGCRCQSRA